MLAILAVSCSKNADDSGQQRLLSRILANGQVNTVLAYDGKDRLVKTTRYFLSGSPVIGSESVNSYNDSGRLVKVQVTVNISSSLSNPQYDQSYAELIYGINGRWAESRNYLLDSNGTTQYVSRSVPDYDANGRVTAIAIFETTSSAMTSKSVYQYNAQGNVVTEQLYQYQPGVTSPLTLERTYTYDQQKNPYFGGQQAMPFCVNTNNITSITTRYFTGTAASNPPVTLAITYKSYNQEGYPVLVNENGVEYTYEYQ